MFRFETLGFDGRHQGIFQVFLFQVQIHFNDFVENDFAFGIEKKAKGEIASITKSVVIDSVVQLLPETVFTLFKNVWCRTGVGVVGPSIPVGNYTVFGVVFRDINTAYPMPVFRRFFALKILPNIDADKQENEQSIECCFFHKPVIVY